MKDRKRPDDRRPAGRAPAGKRNRRKLPKTATEPALVRGVVVAVLALLSTLGVTWADVDKKTLGLIVAVLVAVLHLAQALWTRRAVTPNAKVVARVSPSKEAVVAGEAAAVPTGEPLAVYDVGDVQGRELTLQPTPLPASILGG
jgi:hypothetical protein